ncbi:MAG: CBS domain-containing protein, partial [Planctomycetales bacterium]|nr:CBS domain-containing protein [Planctomycetales bacterium]
MNECKERLLELRVVDAMSSPVECVTATSTMGEAADQLVAWQVSGAPVVDKTGRCLGVLSGADYIRQHAGTCAVATSAKVADDRLEVAGLDVGSELVSRHMSRPPHGVRSNCRLLEAAQKMCDNHIHRLV